MSLPFLNHKKMVTTILSKRLPSAPEGDKKEEGSLHSAASDLMAAVKSEDVARVASALKAAYQICDSEEGEAPEESL